MKTLSLIVALLVSQATLAASYGKFKLKVAADYRDASEVVFLMNSQGDVTILENDDYYQIDTSSFFGELTFDIQSMGDEDFIKIAFTMRDNKLLSGCSAWIDLKNEVLMVYSSSQVELLRWNKLAKKYENITANSYSSQQESCIEELVGNYPSFERF